MILRQLTSIRCQFKEVFCLGWKSDKSLATQNKKMIYLTEQHGNKVHTPTEGAERGHHGLIDKWNDAFEMFLVELVGKLLLIFMIYRVRTWDKVAAREPEEGQSCP